MTHEQIIAVVGGLALLVLSAVSTVAGVVATEVPASAIIGGVLFLVGILVGVLGWIAVQVYTINATTSSTAEIVKGAQGAIVALDGDLGRLTDRVGDLERRVDHLEP